MLGVPKRARSLLRDRQHSTQHARKVPKPTAPSVILKASPSALSATASCASKALASRIWAVPTLSTPAKAITLSRHQVGIWFGPSPAPPTHPEWKLYLVPHRRAGDEGMLRAVVTLILVCLISYWLREPSCRCWVEEVDDLATLATRLLRGGGAAGLNTWKAWHRAANATYASTVGSGFSLGIRVTFRIGISEFGSFV